MNAEFAKLCIVGLVILVIGFTGVMALEAGLTVLASYR